MTAVLDRVTLRRYALPAHFLAGLDRGERSSAPATRPPASLYPRLVAAWFVGSRGDSVCRWAIERDLPSKTK